MPQFLAEMPPTWGTDVELISISMSNLSEPCSLKETTESVDIRNTWWSKGKMDIWYSIIEIERLEPPYKTNCKYYSRYYDGRMSSTKCLSHCVKKRVLRRLLKSYYSQASSYPPILTLTIITFQVTTSLITISHEFSPNSTMNALMVSVLILIVRRPTICRNWSPSMKMMPSISEWMRHESRYSNRWHFLRYYPLNTQSSTYYRVLGHGSEFRKYN